MRLDKAKLNIENIQIEISRKCSLLYYIEYRGVVVDNFTQY